MQTTLKTEQGKTNAVIMGRRTWDSVPAKFRPLKNRLNIVLSSKLDAREISNIPDTVVVCKNLEHAIHHLSSPDVVPTLGKVWILGGSSVYNESMAHPLCEEIYLSCIDHSFECDVFWKGVDESKFVLDAEYSQTETEKDVTYHKLRYVCRPPHPELGYLQLVRNVLANGVKQSDRTGVGTLSQFGAQLRFDLSQGFPLLTTKKMFWKGIRDELLWFIAGDTNAKHLSEKGVKIWDGNGSRKFLDSRGLDYPEGELGPVYGFQWRHFGAEYKGADFDYTNKGVDQLAQCINQIRTQPNSRRILMSAWNPVDLPKMALPPCHVLCQFYVAQNKLSCQLYQRSADLGLGVPFNIASYALLTHLVAHVCNLQVGDFVHSFGDAHVYLNHIEGMKEQLSREPLPFCKLKLNESIKEIGDFTSDDIKLEGYKYLPAMKLEMAL